MLQNKAVTKATTHKALQMPTLAELYEKKLDIILDTKRHAVFESRIKKINQQIAQREMESEIYRFIRIQGDARLKAAGLPPIFGSEVRR